MGLEHSGWGAGCSAGIYAAQESHSLPTMLVHPHSVFICIRIFLFFWKLLGRFYFFIFLFAFFSVFILLFLTYPNLCFCFLTFYFYFILLYNTVLVLPYIDMNPPRCTCDPKHEPPSHLPPHNIPLGHPRAPAPSVLYPASDIDRWFDSYMIVCVFHALGSSQSSCPLFLSIIRCHYVQISWAPYNANRHFWGESQWTAAELSEELQLFTSKYAIWGQDKGKHTYVYGRGHYPECRICVFWKEGTAIENGAEETWKIRERLLTLK